MMRERWGAFSVRDHVSEAPYVSEVLLFDRLINSDPGSCQQSGERAMGKRGMET